MKRAMIDTNTGRIHCVVEREFKVTAPFAWVDAPDQADHTWAYTEGQVVARQPTAVGPDAQTLRAKAEREILEEMLQGRAKDPDAPTAVKEYARLRER